MFLYVNSVGTYVKQCLLLGRGPLYELHSQQYDSLQDWVSPGEVMNKAPPSMACPICGQQEFQTQTDLELHCAQCT